MDNPKKVLIGHLNVNSLRNKYLATNELIKDKIDICLLSETKLNDSFPTAQFQIKGYKIFRKDRNKYGGGIMFYINENIPSRKLDFEFQDNLEILFIEFSLRNRKWLCIGLYKPPSLNEVFFLDSLNKVITSLLNCYENILLIGDFNITINNKNLNTFMNVFDLESLITSPTCFQSINPTCIDLILTNKKNLFMKSQTLEVGISDHHKLVLTILKSQFVKGNPKTNVYRNYKDFNTDSFKIELSKKLSSVKMGNYSNFLECFTKLLDKHAPLKKKVLRYNNNPFMTKTLRKAIMIRSRLKNLFRKNKTIENWEKYKKQRNYCVNLLRKTKKSYLSKLNVKDISDNKRFWKTIKPFFNDKGLNTNKILLKENDDLISDESSVANIFNDFFTNTASNLQLKNDFKSYKDFNMNDLLMRFKDHPSIKKIDEIFPTGNIFFFKNVTNDDVQNEILSLDNSKATQLGDIPVNLLKGTTDISVGNLTNIINKSFENGRFPNELKQAEIFPIFKKKDNLDKENYRPVSILSHMSKVFERLIFKQIDNFMCNKFSPLLTGFRKKHNTQHSLLVMLENWKINLDKGNTIGAIFMDLSKAFDTINHELLIAKLKAYGFSYNALCYMRSYLTNRNQRVNLNCHFSPWKNIITGVPQGSILGPLLFNIFLNDIFFFVTHSCISNYADDNTLFCFGKNIDVVNEKLKVDFLTLITWFHENYMQLNPGKCHYMCLGNNTENTEFSFNQKKLKCSEEETILGVIIDRKLTFDRHIQEICKKAAQKLSALSRIASFLQPIHKKMIFNSMIKSQFAYCPLIWMFCSRISNNTINKIHECSLRIAFNDQHNSFLDILETNNEMTIHQRNIQILMTEIFKTVNDLGPPIMNELLEARNNMYNVRNFQEFVTKKKNTVRYGTETLDYRAPQLWSLLPEEIKESSSLSIFKSNIKKWICTECPCRICKQYIQNLGFL